jgi:rfaE bifunctional protein kinase chain/domain
MTSVAESLRGARVLTVGDLMLDEYVWGQVSRISPEAPVPVVDVERRSWLPGGAGNTAAGVAALDAVSAVCGVVGDDGAGEQLRQALRECGIDCDAVVVEPGRATTIKTRVIAHNQQVVRTDFEERRQPGDAVEEQLLRAIADAVSDADAVVISDYAKGVVSARVAEAAIGAAREHDLPVVVDPKGRNYAKYRGASVLTPNVLDTERAANIHIEGYDDLLEAGRRLRETLDGANLLVTRGAEGMTLLTANGTVDIAAEAHDVYDVTGAGDTVVAVLAVALAQGVELEAAVRLANAAAGLAVGRVGAARITLDELAEAAG